MRRCAVWTVTIVSSPLVPSGNEWSIYSTAASTPCPTSLQCFFLWCVDVFHYPASSSPMLVHCSFKFSLQPVIGGPRSWLQFPGRPLGGLGLDFWLVQRLYQQGESYTPHSRRNYLVSWHNWHMPLLTDLLHWSHRLLPLTESSVFVCFNLISWELPY